MHRLYAVIRTRGPAWQDSLTLERQPEWEAHADFMNSLYAGGFLALVGPLEGTPDVLLIVHAESREEIEAQLGQDPWTRSGLLLLKSASPWTLRLGSL